jgi:hypothetical protein
MVSCSGIDLPLLAIMVKPHVPESNDHIQEDDMNLNQEIADLNKAIVELDDCFDFLQRTGNAFVAFRTSLETLGDVALSDFYRDNESDPTVFLGELESVITYFENTNALVYYPRYTIDRITSEEINASPTPGDAMKMHCSEIASEARGFYNVIEALARDLTNELAVLVKEKNKIFLPEMLGFDISQGLDYWVDNTPLKLELYLYWYAALISCLGNMQDLLDPSRAAEVIPWTNQDQTTSKKRQKVEQFVSREVRLKGESGGPGQPGETRREPGEPLKVKKVYSKDIKKRKTYYLERETIDQRAVVKGDGGKLIDPATGETYADGQYGYVIDEKTKNLLLFKVDSWLITTKNTVALELLRNGLAVEVLGGRVISAEPVKDDEVQVISHDQAHRSTMKTHHTTHVAGCEVTGAGLMDIVGGRITKFSDESGHYRPDLPAMIETARYLKEHGWSCEQFVAVIHGAHMDIRPTDKDDWLTALDEKHPDVKKNDLEIKAWILQALVDGVGAKNIDERRLRVGIGVNAEFRRVHAKSLKKNAESGKEKVKRPDGKVLPDMGLRPPTEEEQKEYVRRVDRVQAYKTASQFSDGEGDGEDIVYGDPLDPSSSSSVGSSQSTPGGSPGGSKVPTPEGSPEGSPKGSPTGSPKGSPTGSPGSRVTGYNSD